MWKRALLYSSLTFLAGFVNCPGTGNRELNYSCLLPEMNVCREFVKNVRYGAATEELWSDSLFSEEKERCREFEGDWLDRGCPAENRAGYCSGEPSLTPEEKLHSWKSQVQFFAVPSPNLLEGECPYNDYNGEFSTGGKP